MQDEGKAIYEQTAASIPETFRRYTGDRTADMGVEWDQMKGIIDELRLPSEELGKTRTILDQMYAMDSAEAGKSIEEKMNPYTQAVLNPTLRNLNEQRGQQLLEADAAATMSGAFGDPMAGLVKSDINNKYNQTVTDASNKAFSDAWGNAQNQHNTVLSRLMGTASAFTGLDSAEFNRSTKLSQYLADIATRENIMKQQDLNIDYENWQQENGGYATNRANTLLTLLGKTPHETYQKGMTSSETSQPDNSGWQAVGTIAGTVIGGMIGGPAGAMLGASLGGALGGAAGGGGGGSLFGGQGKQAGSTGSGQFEWQTPGYF
jgi:hypothetical protein